MYFDLFDDDDDYNAEDNYFDDYFTSDTERELLEDINCKDNFDSLSIMELREWERYFTRKQRVYECEANNCGGDCDVYYDACMYADAAKSLLKKIGEVIEKKYKEKEAAN